MDYFVKNDDGMMFKDNGVNRPILQSIDSDELAICNLKNGVIFVDRDDVDDLIKLLQGVKDLVIDV